MLLEFLRKIFESLRSQGSQQIRIENKHCSKFCKILPNSSLSPIRDRLALGFAEFLTMRTCSAFLGFSHFDLFSINLVELYFSFGEVFRKIFDFLISFLLLLRGFIVNNWRVRIDLDLL